MSASRSQVRQVRERLAARRSQMEADLTALEEHLTAKLNPLRVLRRHPLLTAVAGGIVGVLLIRRPDLLFRTAGRALAWGAPLLLSSLARRTPR